jgi:hypothetical protein
MDSSVIGDLIAVGDILHVHVVVSVMVGFAALLCSSLKLRCAGGLYMSVSILSSSYIFSSPYILAVFWDCVKLFRHTHPADIFYLTDDSQK